MKITPDWKPVTVVATRKGVMQLYRCLSCAENCPHTIPLKEEPPKICLQEGGVKGGVGMNTIQRCPICFRFFRWGSWFKPDAFQLKAIGAAVYAGMLNILDASCKDCEDEHLDGLGHA